MERVHCCIQGWIAPGIAYLLKQNVAPGAAGMVLAVLSVITRILRMPISLTLALIGTVVGIDREFVLLPLPLPGTLAIGLAAVSLILDSWIGNEWVTAMQTHGL